MTESITTKLLVIGAGTAGMAAAIFAAKKGIDCAIAGLSGEIIYASSLLDILAVHPVSEGKLWDNPWHAIEALRKEQPTHPYSRMTTHMIKTAFREFITTLSEAGLHYFFRENANADVITPAGTVKRTYGVPEGIWPAVRAMEEKKPCLLIDFNGLKGYSARQIKEVIGDRWPKMRSERIDFPGRMGDLYPEHMAYELLMPKTMKQLAENVKPHVKDAEIVGFPAILGMKNIRKIMNDLKDNLGVPVFEIPTLPPNVTGLRLKNALEQRVADLGVKHYFQYKVTRIEKEKNGNFKAVVSSQNPGRMEDVTVFAESVILATGRFIGQGLAAERKKIKETLFGLPVKQPMERMDWHRQHFLDPRGHGVNLAGLEVDHVFRPLNENGEPAHDNLFAAGSILADSDWMRMKCGSGLSIASAYAAVDAITKLG